MKILVKKAAVILCLCSIILSACACSNTSALTEKTDLSDTALSEKTDTIITEKEITTQFETTAPAVTEKERLKMPIVDYGRLEETDDAEPARELVIAYVSGIENQEETDLGKYIDNPYLKTYLENDIKVHIENDVRTGRKEISVSVGEPVEKNGIKYIEFQLHHEPDGATAVVIVGMREGKAVNFYDWYHIDMHGNLWCSDIIKIRCPPPLRRRGPFSLSVGDIIPH